MTLPGVSFDIDKVGEELLEQTKIEQSIGNIEETLNTKDKFSSAYVNEVISNCKDTEENYVVSPMSMKYAMCLLALGADGDTKAELMDALGYKTDDEIIAWCSGNQEYAKEIQEGFINSKMNIANSLWFNSDNPGGFSETYKGLVESKLNGVSKEVKSDTLAKEVNAWADEETNGLIKNLLDESIDYSDITALLANALYVKNSWAEQFKEYNTKEKDFKTLSGEVVKKDYLINYNYKNSAYFKDDKSEAVMLPMDNGMCTVFVKGDISNMQKIFDEFIYQGSKTEIEVEIPKMEIDSPSNFNNTNALKRMGINKVFSRENVNLEKMFTGTRGFVNEVGQKAKFILDEKGIEAAAVTYAMVKTCSIAIEEPVKKHYVFKGNEPMYVFMYKMDTDSMNGKDINLYGDLMFFCRYCK